MKKLPTGVYYVIKTENDFLESNLKYRYPELISGFAESSEAKAYMIKVTPKALFILGV